MGSDDIVEILDVHVVADRHEQSGIGQLAARIDKRGMPSVINEELVGLNGLSSDQIAERDADMIVAVVKLHPHKSPACFRSVIEVVGLPC